MDEANVRKLKSSDGKIFEVDEKILNTSKFFKELIIDYPQPDQEITINQVDGKNLEKIIEYLKHYENEKPKEIPKPLPNNDIKSVLSEWDYNFINPLSIADLIDLINAANFLNIDDLVALTAAKLAAEMLTGTIEEVREKFGIKCDMTEEEIAEVDKYPLD
jgi:S-phase kinase-associated protein 1